MFSSRVTKHFRMTELRGKKRMFQICIQIDGRLSFQTENSIAFFLPPTSIFWHDFLCCYDCFRICYHSLTPFSSSTVTEISRFPSPLISFPVTLSVLTTSQRAKRVVSPLPGESIIAPRIDTLTGYCLPRQVTE